MSRVLLISPNREKKPTVYPLGLGYIHAGLKKNGYQAGILDFAHEDWAYATVKKYLLEYKPDYVGISIRNLDNCCYQYPRSFAEQIRQLVEWIRDIKKELKVIIGGSGFSILPEDWMHYTDADFGLCGDGTETFTELIRCLEGRKGYEDIQGIFYKKSGNFVRGSSERMREINGVYPSRKAFIHPVNTGIIRNNVLGKKGCSQRCIYCSYPNLEGRQIRCREPSNIVEEIKIMAKEHGIREFDFVDSVFNNPFEHAQEVCRLLAKEKLNISWGCFLKPSGCTEEFLRLMKTAGCSHAEFGVDTASDTMIRILKKDFTKKDISDSIKNCQKAQLPFNVCLLFGGPSETMETACESLDFMEQLNVEELFGLIGIRILPDTEIYQKYVRGLRKKDLLFPQFYISPKLNVEEFMQKFLSVYKERHEGWAII